MDAALAAAIESIRINVPRIVPAVKVMKARAEECGFVVESERMDGFRAMGYGLVIIVTAEVHGTELWAHVSASYREALPSWAVMKRVKRWVLGSDAKALMVLPPEREHVNIHSFVHHLWSRLDGDPLPDFTMGTGSL